jgi:hypothetical protein
MMIVKKVRFQKNEVAKGAVEKERGGREREIDKLKGQTTSFQLTTFRLLNQPKRL